VCDHPPMKQGPVLATAVAVADVPFDDILSLLTVEGARTLLEVADDAVGVTIGVEADESLVWMHGEFWYQGEYVFSPRPDGTLVTYRIRNVSGTPDLVIRIWQRRMLRAQQTDLERYAAALPRRL
jgi:hypothetical protein